MWVNSQLTTFILALLLSTVHSRTECELSFSLETGSSTDIQYPLIEQNGTTDHCWWTITALNDMDYLHIQFTSFNLEEPINNSCVHEYMAISEGSSVATISKCGHRSPFEYVATSGNVTLEYFADGTVNASDSFTAVVTAVPFSLYPTGRPACGALVPLYGSDRYFIEYPGNTSSFTGENDCIWNIWANDHSKAVKLEFSEFNLEDPIRGECKSEFLDIYEGWMHVQQPLRFCGYLGSFTLITKSYQANLQFLSDSLLKVNHGFKFAVSAVDWTPSEENATSCVTVIALADGASVTIDYPPYGQFYTGNDNCTWHIIASNETTNLNFDFQRFDLQNETSGECKRTYLDIYNGSMEFTDPIRKCGQLDPFTLDLPSNEVHLHFVSEPRVSQFTGFKVVVTTASGEVIPNSKPRCDALIPLTVSSSQEVFYPINGEMSTGNDHCSWQVWSYNHSLDIQVDFIEFNLSEPTGGKCVKEYVEFDELPFNRDDPKRFCGGTRPPSFTTKNYLVNARFFSDPTTKPGHGLSIRFTPVVPKPSDEARTTCTTIVAMAAGATTIVDYPGTGNEYTGNDDCDWIITSSEEDDFIQLYFERFDLEGPIEGVCKNDYLDYFDGPKNTTPTVRKCGHLAPFTLTSSGNMVNLRFVSDARPTVFYGFRIKVTATKNPRPICGGLIRLTDSSTWTISYPFTGGMYTSNERCLWTLQNLDKSKRVQLSFTRFDLEGPTGGECIHDYVELIDGPNKWRKCGHLSPFTSISRSYKVDLSFVSDGREDTVGYGFTVDVTTVNAKNCDKVIPVSENDVTLRLSDYMPQDETYQNCTWTLVASNKNSSIHLHINETEDSHDCSRGYLEVTDPSGNHSPVRVCGEKTDVSGGSEMSLRLVSMGQGSPVSQMQMKVAVGDVGAITLISYPMIALMALINLKM